MTLRRLSAMARAVVLLAALAVPASAQADEQPAILKAYELDWIERVREDAWPQPKSERPVICLLDTGVDITPDTPADNPDGPIVARLALDGGTGVAQGTTWEHQHGTQMASIIAAPRNGYGTVGVFPQARIVSIRVTDSKQEEVYITPGAVARGARRCAAWAEERAVRLGAVVVAESNYSQRQVDTALWDEGASAIRAVKGLMFAAVGNDATASTVPPISSPEVVPVLAADDKGNRCPFSPAVDSARLISASGCRAAPWPDGSSQSTAVAGAVFTALVTKEPQLGVAAALAKVTDTTGRTLNGSVWKATMAGLVADVVSLSTTAPPAAPANPSTAEESAPQLRLWRPRVSARFRRGRLIVRRLDRKGGVLHVRIGGVEHSAKGRVLSIRLPKRPRRSEVWAESSVGKWRSLTCRQRVL